MERQEEIGACLQHIGHGSACLPSRYLMSDPDLGTGYPLKGAREEGKTGQEERDRLVRDKEARRALLRRLNKQGLERGCPHGCLREEVASKRRAVGGTRRVCHSGLHCGTCANNTKVTSNTRKL